MRGFESFEGGVSLAIGYFVCYLVLVGGVGSGYHDVVGVGVTRVAEGSALWVVFECAVGVAPDSRDWRKLCVRCFDSMIDC